VCYVRTVTLPDGVYSVAKMNEVVRGHFESRGLPPASIVFYSNVQGDRMVVEILQPGFLLNLSASSVASFLGFSPATVPHTGRFTEPTTIVAASLQGHLLPQILAASITSHADLAGEWIVKATAGNRHSLVLTYNTVNRLTRVWAFGSNRHGQLGCALHAYTEQGSGVPCLIASTDAFDSALVQDMAAADRHSALLDQAGRVFLFGSDSHGQLGTGAAFNRSQAANYLPRLLTSLEEQSARYSMVFLGYDHTIVFGELKNRSSLTWSPGTKAWGFGSNQYGQLGAPDSQLTAYSNPVLRPIGTWHNSTWVTGCAGDFHTMLLDKDNRLWATGSNQYGQAGVAGKPKIIISTAKMYSVGSELNDERKLISERESFSSQVVAAFACGGEHNLVLTENGELWSFGINDFGQLARVENLGTANANDIAQVPRSQLKAGGSEPQPITGIWAAGSISLLQTAKQPCFPSYYSPDGLQPCFPCAAGTLSNDRGAIRCVACARGYFVPFGMTQCFECARGSYSDRMGQDACTECPASKSYTTQLASIAISNCTLPCAPGTAGPLGGEPCRVCAPGTFSLQVSSSCTHCPRGTFQERNTSSSCLLCPHGKSTANESSAFAQVCREMCSPGYFGASGLAESKMVNGSEERACLPCAVGHFSALNRSHVCQPCDFHSYLEVTGRSSCNQCPDGHGTVARATTNASLCIPFCDEGSVSATGVKPCSLCGAGLSAPQLGLKLCLQCAAGSYSVEGSSECSICPAGSSSLQQSGECRLCDKGKYQGRSNSSACILCPRRFYSDANGSTSCTQCVSGLGTAASGSTSSSDCVKLCAEGNYSVSGLVDPLNPCTECAEGTASNRGPDSAWPTGCLDCPAGFYSGRGSADCLECPPGNYTDESASSACQPCSAGFSSGLGASTCTVCLPGSFASSGSSSCHLCSAGTYQLESGSSFCVLCPKGSFSSQEGQANKCHLCLSGTYSDAQGSTECGICEEGSFSAGNASSCTMCAPGKYASERRNDMCFPCSSGSFAQEEGSAICDPCHPGYAAKAASTSCTLCAQSTWSAGRGTAVCNACPPGYNTSGTATRLLSDCLHICEPGQFGINGLSDSADQLCSSCAKGTISASYYSRACSGCLAGAFASETGMTRCELCPAGSYAPPGSSTCSACSPGKFAAGEGTANCSECPPGKVMPGEGAHLCEVCGYGRYSLPHRLSCAQCGPTQSTAYQTSASRDDCIAFCPAGTYGVDNGVASVANPCRSCPPGSYSNFSKQSSCFLCPAGSFSNNSLGALACQECPLDMWQNLTGSIECRACPTMDGNCSDSADCFVNVTRTILPGASSEALCRVYSKFTCLNSPRRLGAYPMYAVGDNAYGQALFSENDRKALNEWWNTDIQPFLATCDLFGGEEVAKVGGSKHHSMVQTAEWTPSHSTRFRTSLWTFGRNSHGQLGTSHNIALHSRNPFPSLLPRSLFPSLLHGNTISQGLSNNRFHYLVWDTNYSDRVLFTVTIEDGIYTAADLAEAVSSKAASDHGHPENVFRVTYSNETQGVIFAVTQPGFQADFSTDDTMRDNFGFLAPFKFPPQGTVNEVSQRAENNVFRFRRWCTSPPACGNEYSTHSLVLPDGLYTLEKLNAAVRTFSSDSGIGEFAFYFGLEDDKVMLFVSEMGLQVDLMPFHVPVTFEKFLRLFDSSLDMHACNATWCSSPCALNCAATGKSQCMYECFIHSEVGRQHGINQDNSIGRFLGFEMLLYPASGPTNSTGYRVLAELARGNLNYQNLKAVETRTESWGQDPLDFALGGFHSLVRTHDAHGRSRLWSFGSNRYGQLGSPVNAGTDLPNNAPQLVSGFDELNGGQKAVRFAAGEHHSMVQTADGSLWVFGSNRYGQLGLANNSGLETANWQPLQWDYAGRELIEARRILVADFRLGMKHSLVLVTDADLGNTTAFSFGSNEYGQLTRSENAGLCRAGDVIKACRSFHDESRSPSSLLPLPNHVPRPVTIVGPSNPGQEDLQIERIRGGGQHTILQTRDGRLWCAGSNRYGQCGVENDISLDSDSLDYPAYENLQYVLKLVGSQYVSNTREHVVAPDLICCAPRDPAAINGGIGVSGCTCASGQWRLAGSCTTCPFGGKTIRSIITAQDLSLVQTDDDLWWSFGINSAGQLLRTTSNLGLANANIEPEVVAKTPYGDSNQRFLDVVAGATADHSFVQTYRAFCAPGNHSMDRRSPCLKCQAGSISSLASKSVQLYSFDQSVVHPHSVRFPLRMRASAVFLDCRICDGGSFSTTSSSACSTCPRGTYSFSGAPACHQVDHLNFGAITQ
jgi:alpha-tubulin suppressor-like RCC1 family protein